jgi:hypothetical protein
LAGGCHLNRDVPELLGRAGFRLEDPHTMYNTPWRPATWNLWGVARPG